MYAKHETAMKSNEAVLNYLPALLEKCPYSGFFWIVFSRIRTEDREILRLRLYSEWEKIRTRITPKTDTFDAVLVIFTQKRLMRKAQIIVNTLQHYFKLLRIKSRLMQKA